LPEVFFSEAQKTPHTAMHWDLVISKQLLVTTLYLSVLIEIMFQLVLENTQCVYDTGWKEQEHLFARSIFQRHKERARRQCIETGLYRYSVDQVTWVYLREC